MSDETPPPPGPTPDPATSELAALRAQFDNMALELATLQRQLSETEKRALSDYQSALRRAEIREQQARDGQTRSLAQSLTTVLDHFDQALKVDPATAKTDDVLAGVSMVHAELIKSLASFGIVRIDLKPGDAYDPRFHQALMRQKVEGLASGTVAACFQPGYRLGDILIRPAQVSVAE